MVKISAILGKFWQQLTIILTDRDRHGKPKNIDFNFAFISSAHRGRRSVDNIPDFYENLSPPDKIIVRSRGYEYVRINTQSDLSDLSY